VLNAWGNSKENFFKKTKGLKASLKVVTIKNRE
jgi:hypothetical protein